LAIYSDRAAWPNFAGTAETTVRHKNATRAYAELVLVGLIATHLLQTTPSKREILNCVLGVFKEFKKALKETNPSIEFVVEEFPKFGATDYTPTINEILAAKPDYVFTVLFGNDLITFAKQATAVDFFKQINNRFGALYDFNTLKTMGDQAPVGTDGVQRAPANYLIKNNPEAASFIADYKSKKCGYPSDWTIMSYDCVNTWAQAANSAKSLNADEVMRASLYLPKPKFLNCVAETNVVLLRCMRL
jgi:ABC-type branched-subunit amino acid transport system substrate-binding protein